MFLVVNINAFCPPPTPPCRPCSHSTSFRSTSTSISSLLLLLFLSMSFSQILLLQTPCIMTILYYKYPDKRFKSLSLREYD